MLESINLLENISLKLNNVCTNVLIILSRIKLHFKSKTQNCICIESNIL